jgi:hypothetical protein
MHCRAATSPRQLELDCFKWRQGAKFIAALAIAAKRTDRRPAFAIGALIMLE